MKRFAFVLIALLAVALTASAQFSTNASIKTFNDGGKVIKFVGTISSTTAYTSNGFSLAGYQGEASSTYPPLAVDYSLDTADVAAGTDVDSVKAIIQGSNDESNWKNVDTLSTVGFGTVAQTYTTLDLNAQKWAYYRWVVTGVGSNTGATITINCYAYRKDGNK